MTTPRRPLKKRHPEAKVGKVKAKAFEFIEEDEEKYLSGSEDEVRTGETPIHGKMTKKRRAAEFDAEGAALAVGNKVHSMLEELGADISKVMLAKRKRLECLTKNYMKGSRQKLEQLWNNHHTKRQRLTQQYSQEVSSALLQWEAEAKRAEEQQEKFNNLFIQQQKILQQARVAQSQKLKVVRDLYEHFVQNLQDREKSHDAFLQGAHLELKKEMATLQKKILMDTQQQEMATVRKSLQSMLY